MSKIDNILSIALKRGFFFPTAEIYGGKAGFFTYGHLGKLMKNKFENLWRSYFLRDENFYEIQSNNILPNDVFKASGHIENFNDPFTNCKSCHFIFRADQLLEDSGIDVHDLSIEEMTEEIRKNKLRCPKCRGELSDVKWFNMMFGVNIGFKGEKAYLSPETAQAAYLAFKQEFEATRKKLPLGLAIIDKAYRNEISPRQLFFRLREFTQAELQIFFDPEEINEAEEWNTLSSYELILFPVRNKRSNKILVMDCDKVNKELGLPKFYIYYMAKIQKFYLDVLGIPQERFRFRELSESERAFYNKIHWDIELKLDTLNGFKEVAGIHYRTDHDLAGHERVSKKNLHIFYNNKKFIPHVLELSFGIDRNLWAFFDIFYETEKERSLFRFPASIAPVDVAVFPLVSKDGLPALAKDVYNLLKETNLNVFYDSTSSIGRRYRRTDEIGCPAGITIDYETLKNNTITLRDRDSMKQIRVKITELEDVLSRFLGGIELNKLGKIIN